MYPIIVIGQNSYVHTKFSASWCALRAAGSAPFVARHRVFTGTVAACYRKRAANTCSPLAQALQRSARGIILAHFVDVQAVSA